MGVLLTNLVFAHTGVSEDGSDWQLLSDHLKEVANGARRRVESNRCGDEKSTWCRAAEIAGWLHDLGKYRPDFQDYLFGRPVEKEKRYHKQAGAAKAAQLDYNAVAFAIAGHHGGMPQRPLARADAD